MRQKRRYLDDAYTWSFQGRVQALKTTERGTWLALESTYFYPEGGGQPADRGAIGPWPVKDVRLEGDQVWHLLSGLDPGHSDSKTEKPFEVTAGQVLPCHIDGVYRHDIMCQHSAQHILSAILDHHFTTATVGFHLTEDNLTIDTDTLLTPDQWSEIETLCNHWLRDNLEMVAHYPTPNTLSSYKLRKAPKVTEGIRLIALGDRDVVPCGGTHVAKTGELGLIKIQRVDKYKAGQRVFFMAGQRALDQMQGEAQLVKRLTSRYGTTRDLLEASLDQLEGRLAQAQSAYQATAKQLAEMEARHHLAQASPHGIISLWDDQRPADFMRALFQALSKEEAFTGAILMGYKDDKGAQFMLRAPIGIPAGALLALAKQHFDLKGGGTGASIQAGSKAIETVEAAYAWLLNHLHQGTTSP